MESFRQLHRERRGNPNHEMKAVGKIASKDRNHWMVDLMYHPFWQPNGNDNNDDYDNSDDNDDNNDDNDDNDNSDDNNNSDDNDNDDNNDDDNNNSDDDNDGSGGGGDKDDDDDNGTDNNNEPFVSKCTFVCKFFSTHYH